MSNTLGRRPSGVTLAGFRLSRRRFLQSGLAAPALASVAGALEDNETEVDLAFAWNEAETELKVTLILDSIVMVTVDGKLIPALAGQPKAGKTWVLRPTSFGPEARFVLGRRGASGDEQRGYRLRVLDASIGRVTGRRFDLEFRRYPDPDRTDNPDKLYTRFRVSADVRLFSSADSPLSVRSFGLETRDKTTNELVYPRGDWRNFPRFTDIAGGDATLAQIITAGQVGNTFRLMFNGMVGFGNAPATSRIRVDFNHDASWTVAVPDASRPLVAIQTLHQDLALESFHFAWAPAEKPAETGTDSAKDPWRKPHLTGWGHPKAMRDLDFGSGSGPRVLVRHKGATSPDVYLRAAPIVTEGAATEYLTEAGMVLQHCSLALQGAPAETLGDLPDLHLRLLARTTATPAMSISEAVQLPGTLTIDGYAREAEVTHHVVSPIGGLKIAVLAEREKGDPAAEEAAQPDIRDLSFAARTPRPVLIALSWTAGKRDRPTTDWIELHTRLNGADLALPGADSSRLDFDATDLLIHCAPGGLSEEPLTSVLRLGALDLDQGPRARLDLTRATLRAGRGADLLSLTFRFLDISLVCRGAEMELVALSPRCLAYSVPYRTESGRSAAPEPALPDVRPILVVEFPPQHLMESALAVPNDPDPADVEVAAPLIDVNPTTGQMVPLPGPAEKENHPPLKGWLRVNINNRRSVVEALARMPALGTRMAFRTAILNAKKGAQDKDFNVFLLDAVPILKALGRNAKLPPDQQIYIGPYALDPDALGAMRLLARDLASEKLATALAEMASEVRRQAKAILNLADPDSAVGTASSSPANGLILEGLLESAVPSYGEFRSWYRDWAIAAFESGDLDGPTSLDAAEIEAFWQALPITKDPPEDPTVPPDWASKTVGLWPVIMRRVATAWDKYTESLKKPEQPQGLTEGRLSGPTRLAFRLKCRDGLVAGRLRVPALDHDPDLTGRPADPAASPDLPGLRRERFTFSLAELTAFGDMELSVTRRAQRIYIPDGGGRVDPGSRRRLQLNAGAMLDHLGFRSGRFLTSSERLADIQASLVAPSRYETAIEIPARLILSPHQEAIFLTRRQVPESVYNTRKSTRDGEVEEAELPEALRPLWSADLLTGRGDPGLRAVYSPDLAPDFVWRRLHQASLVPAGKDAAGNARRVALPGGAAPLRGPWAPWMIGREETGLEIPSLRDLAAETGDADVKLFAEAETDEAFCTAIEATGDQVTRRNKIADLITYLCGRRTKRKPSERRFRAPMDARARHELVLLTSAWGLPVVGRRNLAGGLAENSSQVEPDVLDRPVDLYPGHAMYLPKTLDVRELSLTSLGGSFRHDTMFEPPAGARHISGAPLFDALSIEKWQQWTLLGRDIICEIVYKGFLFPFGHRASLVQLTERTFFQDTGGTGRAKPVRAYLNQRLFIRVGKPEKEFSAIGQPLDGRMFPARSVEIVTRETPDLTDPMADYPSKNPQNAETKDLPGGRIEIPTSTGLAFWPRTARSGLANVRFEVRIDGTKTDLPLIFADNVLANHPEALEKLVGYYNALARADLRLVALGGEKMRYADERESGSASIETQSWHLAASGGQSAKPTRNGDKIDLTNGNFDFTPILQGADQPPFYPVVESAQIYLRQTEKLTGQTFGPVLARFDGAYLANGLPAIADDQPKDRTAEMYLAVELDTELDIGDGGDRAGGIVRPNATPVGFSRARGVLTWDKKAVLVDGTKSWDEVSAQFHTEPKGGAPGPVPAVPPVLKHNPTKVAARAFAEAKLLGTIRMSKMLEVLTALNEAGVLGEAVSELTELVRYGAESLKLNELVAVVRDGVILPLSDVAADARALWTAAEAEITEAQGAAGEALGKVTLAELFPELDAGLNALSNSLQTTLRETDPLVFSLSLGAVYEAGRRLIDAVARTLSNPVERFELALKSRISKIREVLDRIRDDLPGALLSALEFSGSDLKALVLDWLENKLFWLEEHPIRFFEPSQVWKSGNSTIDQPIEEALKSLTWKTEEFKGLVMAFAGFSMAQVLSEGIEATTDARQIFRDFLNEQLADLSPKLPALTIPTTPPPQTVTDWLLGQSIGKLNAAKQQLDSAASEAEAAVVAEIDGLIAALEAAREKVEEAIDWLVEEFWRELLIIDAACATFNNVRKAIGEKHILPAAQEALRFVELFTGPTGIDLVKDCNDIVKAIAGLLEALDVTALSPVPKDVFTALPVKTDGKFDFTKQDHGLILFQIGQLHDIAAETEMKVAEAATKVDGEVQKLSPELQPKANQLRADITAAQGDVKAIRDATDALLTDLVLDVLTAQALNDRVARFRNAVLGAGEAGLCRGDTSALKEFRHLDRDLVAFARNRAAIVDRVQSTLATLAKRADALASNGAAQIAGSLAALVAVLDAAGVSAGDLESVAKDAKEALDDADRKLAAGIIHILDWGLGKLSKVVGQLDAIREKVLNKYGTLIEPYVALPGFRENLAQFSSYVEGFSEAKALVARLKSEKQVPDDPADATDARYPTLSDLKAKLEELKGFGKLELIPVNVEPGALTFANFADLEKSLQARLSQLEALAARIALQSFELAEGALDQVIETVLTTEITTGGPTVPQIYATIAQTRKELAKELESATGGYLSVSLKLDEGKLDTVRQEALKAAAKRTEGDALDADEVLLTFLSTSNGVAANKPLRDYALTFVKEWSNGGSTPVRLADKVLDIARKLIRGDVLKLIDLNRLRDDIEARLKSLLPVEIRLKHSFAVTLEDGPVREATGGLLQPQGNPMLRFGGEVKIDALAAATDSGDAVTFSANGSLGRFDIKLVGDFIDALTLRFAGARFTAGTGQKARFDVDYIGHEVGPALEFVEQLSAILNPGSGSGPYMRPTFSPIGIQAGYMLDVGAFSLGAVAFDNIKLDCSVILPFSDDDARFRASLSSRDSPFTISYLPWGGSGFFAIEANPDGIVSLELQFEFGGAAIFAFGPLVGRGRAMAGLYVRTITQDDRRITEIQATFFVGGSAKIWIFSFGASLLVRLGQVDGAMTGEAVFTYSFSIGIKDFEFSVRIVKKENKGYSGNSSNGSVRSGSLYTPRRYAQVGALGADQDPPPPDGANAPKLPSTAARIDTTTFGPGEDWARYSRYFKPFKSKEHF